MKLLSNILKRFASGGEGRPVSKQERKIEATMARFQEHLGFTFTHKELLRQALTHRSATSGDTSGENASESNERLEFLGDSVLGLVVNEHLFHEYPRHREGLLTQMKSLLVSRAILSVKAREMKVGDYLFLSSGEEESGGRDRSSILADSFEAVIGAIYLDKGMEAARSFIKDKLMADSKQILEDRNHINYKSMLQEHIQSEKKIHPQYRVTSEDGPDHEKVFTVDVMVGKKVLGRGKGKNKKQAQQEAARVALRSLDLLPARNETNGTFVGNFVTGRPKNNHLRGNSNKDRARKRGPTNQK
jgi:ribonuclease-3